MPAMKRRTSRRRIFVNNAFRDGSVPTGGTAITKILPPSSRFSAENNHSENKHRVLEKITAFFTRFSGLSSPERDES